jgi:hypothetical protein
MALFSEMMDEADEKDREIGELRSENQRLRAALVECLDWMEETRASGDCGFWDWQPGDVYSKGRDALGNV